MLPAAGGVPDDASFSAAGAVRPAGCCPSGEGDALFYSGGCGAASGARVCRLLAWAPSPWGDWVVPVGGFLVPLTCVCVCARACV